MANLLRSAKSSKEWTQNEFLAYNISVTEQELPTFFGMTELPLIKKSVVLFTTTDQRHDAPDDDTYKLLHYLDLAKTAVTPLVDRLLERLGYAQGRRRRVTLTHQSLPFLVCGHARTADADVSVIDENDFILLLVLTDTHCDDPEPQLVAAAVAAFQRNSQIRARELRLGPLEEITLPAIAFYGTCSVFYKITITAALNNAIITGTFPDVETVVLRHTPVLPRPFYEGMRPLSNRARLVAYLQAFKHFV